MHSLPSAKRYGASGFEHAEVRRRHRAVAKDVLGENVHSVILFDDECDGRNVSNAAQAAGMPSGHFPKLWQLSPDWWDEDTGVFACPICIFGAEGSLNPAQFDRLVDEVSNARCQFVVTDFHSGRVYAPYDGGADLIYSTEAERDVAAERFSDWLSDREDGL